MFLYVSRHNCLHLEWDLHTQNGAEDWLQDSKHEKIRKMLQIPQLSVKQQQGKDDIKK